MPISLLNIDRDSDRSLNQIMNSIDEEIQTILDMVSSLGSSELKGPRLMIFRKRMKDLQNVISEFGELVSISTSKKQQIIFELHPRLLEVSNAIYNIDTHSDRIINTCISYLLTHLCSSAAANPKSVVIGVSNILAQVLSQEIGVKELPEITSDFQDPAYFEEFQVHFNYILTSAGLFAAPVLGLPDIAISALGNWADLAFDQFGHLRQFIVTYFNPNVFYSFDKSQYATVPFDSSKDIINALLYENEFLYQLSSRADLLSGIEIPGTFSPNNRETKLTSVEEVTNLFCRKILENCKLIDDYISRIHSMYSHGSINRNENPQTDEKLIEIQLQKQAWEIIAEFGILMTRVFQDKPVQKVKLPEYPSNFPSYDPENPLQSQIMQYMIKLYSVLDKYSDSNSHSQDFIESSKFTNYRLYFRSLLTMVVFNDLYSNSFQWATWLKTQFSHFFASNAIEYNPINVLIIGMHFVWSGIMSSEKDLTIQGYEILKATEAHMEFQFHHIITIHIVTKFVELYNQESTYSKHTQEIIGLIGKFIDEYEIHETSMLFQKLKLYEAMLGMYEEMGVFIRKQNERVVPFDVFSWLFAGTDEILSQVPWVPLNTSIENLNVG